MKYKADRRTQYTKHAKGLCVLHAKGISKKKKNEDWGIEVSAAVGVGTVPWFHSSRLAVRDGEIPISSPFYPWHCFKISCSCQGTITYCSLVLMCCAKKRVVETWVFARLFSKPRPSRFSSVHLVLCKLGVQIKLKFD